MGKSSHKMPESCCSAQHPPAQMGRERGTAAQLSLLPGGNGNFHALWQESHSASHQTNCSSWKQRGCSLAAGQSWRELCSQKKLWIVRTAAEGEMLAGPQCCCPPSPPQLAHLGLVLDRQVQLELSWELILRVQPVREVHPPDATVGVDL